MPHTRQLWLTNHRLIGCQLLQPYLPQGTRRATQGEQRGGKGVTAQAKAFGTMGKSQQVDEAEAQQEKALYLT